jgi:hypothetical protein
MKRSINEIQGMVLKAARGAGVPLGVGEDLARAVPFFIESNALQEVTHLIDGACAEAQTAIDSATVGDAIAPPATESLTALKCLAASQGLHLDVKDGTLHTSAKPQISAATGPQVVPDALWSQLEAWAAKTYVPASEASRIAGAGAGLTDND